MWDPDSNLTHLCQRWTVVLYTSFSFFFNVEFPWFFLVNPGMLWIFYGLELIICIAQSGPSCSLLLERNAAFPPRSLRREVVFWSCPRPCRGGLALRPQPTQQGATAQSPWGAVCPTWMVGWGWARWEAGVNWSTFSVTLNIEAANIWVLGWSEVLLPQLCPTLWDPLDWSLPGSSVHGILQARILEWLAISFSGGSSQHRDRTLVSCIAGSLLTVWATREAGVIPWKFTHFVTSWPWLSCGRSGEGRRVFFPCALHRFT